MKLSDVKILNGNALAELKNLPENSVHTCITSPPYFGLRQYGTNPQIWGGDENCVHEWQSDIYKRRANENKPGALQAKGNPASLGRNSPISHSFCDCGAWFGELGLEPTPQLFTEHLVLVCQEVFRVLRDDGTFWLNLGDSYANDNKWGGNSHSKNYTSSLGRMPREKISTGLKPKNLMGIPWRVAFALQDNGWYLRQDIIWQKPNPMPESVTDRCTKSHEYIFLLSKSEKYFYDYEAIKEPATENNWSSRLMRKSLKSSPTSLQNGIRTKSTFGNRSGELEGLHSGKEYVFDGTRNKRSVWTVTTKSYAEAHFATFPEKLIEPCVLAGTSEKGCCADCGAPYKRIVQTNNPSKEANIGIDMSNGAAKTGNPQTSKGLHRNGSGVYSTAISLGWQKSCSCSTSEIIPCTVIDPFNGAGTTGVVALKNNRSYVGIELNPDYIKLTENRMKEIQRKLF